MTTDRQKSAVVFSEKWTGFKFKDFCVARFGYWHPGFLDNHRMVSGFLSLHLQDAKDNYDIACYDAMESTGDLYM